MTERTCTFTRADFLSEDDWQRAMREGGTFNLREGCRVSFQPPGAVLIDDTDFDPVDVKWSVSIEPVEPNPETAAKEDIPTGFWWASIEGREPEVVHVSAISFDHKVAYATGSDCDIELDDVRLIEPVLPPGRATAAALHCALVASSRDGSGYVSRLQGCQVTDDEGEPTGKANTIIDGYFDLQRAAEILAAGGDAA